MAHRVSDTAHRAGNKVTAGARKVPGPSPNPATNLLIADIFLQGATLLFRQTMQKGMLRLRFDADRAKDIVKGRTLMQSAISYAAGSMATKSIPGFLVVSTGLVAKSIVDRAMGSRKAGAEGTRDLLEQAENAPDDSTGRG
ncbi:hypothetical protein PK98_01305 [Croceibacterium mercuriale]|uniref:Uncharacterized protein n=1 Tax=Croceibacterium mercuriale TaxID=1572751 RepID=A0A0B2BYV6_9SPHN|nr:hypothetical protein PK98_01305 [Croceibacterium mercuriale]